VSRGREVNRLCRIVFVKFIFAVERFTSLPDLFGMSNRDVAVHKKSALLSLQTLAGLSGVGDLMLTCFSSLSRNNRCGKALAKGKTIEEAFQEIGEVVEGVPTAHEVVAAVAVQRSQLRQKEGTPSSVVCVITINANCKDLRRDLFPLTMRVLLC